MESKGLGDTVEKAIKAATLGKVKPCNSCKKRKDKLNSLFPYKRNRIETGHDYGDEDPNHRKKRTPGDTVLLDFSQPNTTNVNVKIASERWKAYLKQLHK
tara:strand:- start:270 stop:569 length:300 start_codon:yes stop_codon:yes gene_type:complete